MEKRGPSPLGPVGRPAGIELAPMQNDGAVEGTPAPFKRKHVITRRRQLGLLGALTFRPSDDKESAQTEKPLTMVVAASPRTADPVTDYSVRISGADKKFSRNPRSAATNQSRTGPKTIGRRVNLWARTPSPPAEMTARRAQQRSNVAADMSLRSSPFARAQPGSTSLRQGMTRSTVASTYSWAKSGLRFVRP